jgi:hypothetical protein
MQFTDDCRHSFYFSRFRYKVVKHTFYLHLSYSIIRVLFAGNISQQRRKGTKKINNEKRIVNNE